MSKSKKQREIYKQIVHAYGVFYTHGYEQHFVSNIVVRRWRKMMKLEALSKIAACRVCGERDCVEEGPCGGAVCMLFCHACGRSHYGHSSGIPAYSEYADRQSHYRRGRLAGNFRTVTPESFVYSKIRALA